MATVVDTTSAGSDRDRLGVNCALRVPVGADRARPDPAGTDCALLGAAGAAAVGGGRSGARVANDVQSNASAASDRQSAAMAAASDRRPDARAVSDGPDQVAFAGHGRRGTWRWGLLLGIVLAVQIVASIPVALDFKLFAFYDPGAALKTDWLISPAGGGKVPTTDFAWSYGLATLEAGRVWFGIFGRSPWAFWAMSSLAMIGWTAGLYRLGRALNFSAGQWAILVCSMPLVVPAYFLSVAHAIEGMLLIHALADQARGNYRRGLVLVTLAAMFKPSMAYVYGLILLGMIVWKMIRGKPQTTTAAVDGGSEPARGVMRRLTRELGPAAGVGVVMCGISAAWFGIGPMIRTLLPLTARESYRAAGFGFFTPAGRSFWQLNDAMQYLFMPAGWWLVSTGVMGIAAARVIVRRMRGRSTRGGGTLLTITILHGVFVTCLYAWSGSWVYYAYLPAVGLAMGMGVTRDRRSSRVRESGEDRAMDSGSNQAEHHSSDLTSLDASDHAGGNVLGKLRRWMVWPVLVLVICGSGARASQTIVEWRGKSIRAEAAGLWIYDSQLISLRNCQRQVRGHKTYWLVNGFAGQMLEGVQTPPSWWLSPALQNEREIAAIRQSIASSDRVVRWAEHGKLDPWLYPELADLTKDFEPVFTSEWFIIEARTSR